MNEDGLHNKMREQCLNDVRNSGWWIFNKKSIAFDKTQIINECNIQIIQQLPDKICFPEKTEEVVITDKGLKNNSEFYSWSDVIATGIRKEAIPMEYMDNYKTSILIGFISGKIVEVEIRKNNEYINQIGHLIELYKIKYKKHQCS